jgi:hypothetical protein
MILDDGRVLRISDIKHDVDTGVYQCNASNPSGFVFANAYINVLGMFFCIQHLLGVLKFEFWRPVQSYKKHVVAGRVVPINKSFLFEWLVFWSAKKVSLFGRISKNPNFFKNLNFS